MAGPLITDSGGGGNRGGGSDHTATANTTANGLNDHVVVGSDSGWQEP